MFDSSIALGNMELMFLINFQSSVEREYTKVQPSFWVFEGDRGKKKKRKKRMIILPITPFFVVGFRDMFIPQ